MKRPLFLIASMGAVLLSPSSTSAAQCSAVVGDLAFGPVDTLSTTGSSASTSLTINCDQISESAGIVTVCGSLGAGTGGASNGVRLLLQGGDALQFGLYADAPHSLPWGHYSEALSGAPLRLELAVTDGQASAVLSVFGEVFGSQSTVPPGLYGTSLSGNAAIFHYDEGDALDCSSPSGLSTNADFSVAAEVLPNCFIVAGDLDFGNSGLIDHSIDAAADIIVTCTPGTSYEISLDGGSSGVPSARIMQSGSNALSYGLYMNAARTQPWGEGAAVKSGEGEGQSETHTVYGRVAPQMAPPGTYSDTVVVTVLYE